MGSEMCIRDRYITHPPLDRYSMVGIYKVRIVSVPKRPALATSRRELSENVSFGVGTIGTLLVVEQSSSENRRPRGVRYTPSYTVGGPYKGIIHKTVHGGCFEPFDGMGQTCPLKSSYWRRHHYTAMMMMMVFSRCAWLISLKFSPCVTKPVSYTHLTLPTILLV